MRIFCPVKFIAKRWQTFLTHPIKKETSEKWFMDRKENWTLFVLYNFSNEIKETKKV